MRIWPPLGFSNPEISRRQVVFPEPEGPSMAKKLPSAMVRLTSSTARTEPKWRETDRNSTAAVMEGPDKGKDVRAPRDAPGTAAR